MRIRDDQDPFEVTLETPLPGMYHHVPHRDVLGHVLRLDSGLVVVPYRAREQGWWDVVIIWSAEPRYPVGGYHLAISPRDVFAATRLPLEKLE